MKFECLNQECGKYGDSVTHLRVTLKVINGETIHCDKIGGQLLCDVCFEPLNEFKEEFKGFGTFFGGFSSKTPEEKREILKKREREHYKRDKNAHEYKKFKDNEL